MCNFYLKMLSESRKRKGKGGREEGKGKERKDLWPRLDFQSWHPIAATANSVTNLPVLTHAVTVLFTFVAGGTAMLSACI